MCGGHCAVRDNDYSQFSSHYSVCDNGATLLMAEAFRWVLEPSAFEASDGRAASCARRVRRQPSEFGLVHVPVSHVARMLRTAAEPVTAPDGRLVPTRRLAVVYNQMAHVHDFIKLVARCYEAEARLPAAQAASAAVRDVMRYWGADQAQWARVFEAARSNASTWWEGAGAPPRLDVYYRTSPAACDAFCVAPNGAPRGPIEPAALIDSVVRGHAEYSHDLVFRMNDVARAAFSAQGLPVVDLESMLSVRVDAYPASRDGIGDKLHFCQPGPGDWALDVLLRRLAASMMRG